MVYLSQTIAMTAGMRQEKKIKNKVEENNSPVAMLSVHAHSTVVAGVSGICGTRLMGLFSAWAGAHRCGFNCHRHKTHSPTIHHCGRVPHVQSVGAATCPATLGAGTLIHPDLEHADLQERLELDGKRKREHLSGRLSCHGKDKIR